MKADLQKVYDSTKESKGVEAALNEVKEKLLSIVREEGRDACSVGLDDGNRVAVSRVGKDEWEVHFQYRVIVPEKITWEGYYDRHAWLDNGLHLRVTRIDIPKASMLVHEASNDSADFYFWMWDIQDPMIRVAVDCSLYHMKMDDHPKDLDEAERQCIEAAKRIKPYGA